MKAGYTHIVLITDESGSMFNVLDDTRGGLNQLIQDQKKAPGECTMTLLTFSDRPRFVFTNENIKDVEFYYPNASGFTALYDAIGRAIDDTGKWLESLPESDRPEKVIVTIITDGDENSSTEYALSTIKEKIETQTTQYNWAFTFIGANQDAILTGVDQLGLASANCLSFDINKMGGTYGILSSKFTSARSASVKDFAESFTYSDAERSQVI